MDCGQESYIVQLDFSAAFDRVSHDGVILKLRSAGVGGCLLSICREFLTDRRQRVVVDGASSEWIPIVSGVPQGSVFGPLLFVLYTSEMFDLVENRFFTYADDSTLRAVIRRSSDRPTLVVSVNRDLARIHERCGHWCMLLNPKKSKALVVSRSRIVYPPHGDLGLAGVPILSNPSLDILGVRFDCRLTFESHVLGVVSQVSQRIGILRILNGVYADTSVLLRCCYAFILPILEYCSPVWGSAASSHLRLLDRQIHAVSRLCPDQIPKPLNHRRCFAGMCMLYKIHSNPKHCLYSALPPACQRVRHTRAAAVAHPCELEVPRCRTSQFGRCFLPAHVRM